MTSKLNDLTVDVSDNVWQLDNCVNLLTTATQHRTWRPVRAGRPVYGDPGFQLFTMCGRPLPKVAGHVPGPRCGTCFRGVSGGRGH